MTARVHLRFAEFVFDGGGRQLLREGHAVHLSPKAFDLLGALLARRPRAVSQDDLLHALWPGTFVGRTSVAQLVNEVRRALADDPRRPRFLRTVHRFGYAWVGGPPEEDAGTDASIAGDAPPCRIVWGTAEIPLREGENLIGRAADAAVRISSAKVSRRHARITVAGDRAQLEDLGSRNGTFLGKRKVSAPVTLADGDEIVIGPAVLVFVGGSGSARATETG